MKNLKSMKRILIILALILTSATGFGQQDAQITQYMYNMSVINPAYATGEIGMLNLGGLYRSQWVGVTGAPQTANFFAHYAISDKIEAGISVVRDEIGDIVTEDNIYADFAYVLQVSETANLSLGLKAGVSFFNTNFNGLQFTDDNIQPDPAFQNNINETFPNLGVGAFYFTDNFYLGVSAPNLLTSKHLDSDLGIRRIGAEEIHFFATSGYVFDLGGDVKFKPSFMVKGVKGAPLAIDINANVLINNRFEAGLGYRMDDAIIGMVNFKVTPSLRVGYAYDYTTSRLGDFGSGSHEVFLLFDLDFLGLSKGYDKSPRFF